MAARAAPGLPAPRRAGCGGSHRSPATRGPDGESTYRRTFAQVSANVLDAVLGAWLWTRAAAAGGRPVIAADGKTVRGAKGKDVKAPHLAAALAHGTSAVPGQVTADAKSDEIPPSANSSGCSPT